MNVVSVNGVAPGRARRDDIQGLCALAVLMVVAHHDGRFAYRDGAHLRVDGAMMFEGDVGAVLTRVIAPGPVSPGEE